VRGSDSTSFKSDPRSASYGGAGGATVCQKAMRREESLPTLIATPQIAPPIIHELRLSNDDSSGHRGVGAVKNAFENLRGRDFINDDGVAG